jgi:ABC-2 type transport system permease protein
VRPLLAIAWIELLRLLRSPMSFTLLLLIPALQVLLFGTAIRPEGAKLSVSIAAPNAIVAQRVAKELSSQPNLLINPASLKPGEADASVRAGKSVIGIEAPASRSFANPFAKQEPLRVTIDASNAAMVAAAIPGIEAAYWKALAERADSVDTAPGLKITRLYNAEARADWTFLPALIGVTVMISMIMLGSLSLARERESGTWESLSILPMSAFEILAGKLLPYVVIGTIQGALVLAAGVWLFDLPTRGSVVALVALLPVFAAAHLALGYAISVRAKTQLAALQGAVAFYLPAMLLSGFLYPFETLPHWARIVGSIFPLTHFIRAAQSALLKGESTLPVLSHVWPMLLFLTAVSAFALIAHRRNMS